MRTDLGLRWWGRWDLNPGSHAPQACILVQARRRPHCTGRPVLNGKVNNALIKLKLSGLAGSTGKRALGIEGSQPLLKFE